MDIQIKHIFDQSQFGSACLYLLWLKFYGCRLAIDNAKVDKNTKIGKNDQKRQKWPKINQKNQGSRGALEDKYQLFLNKF